MLWSQRGLELLSLGDQYPGGAGTLANVASPLVFGSFLASATSLFVRFRRASGDQRQQLKWLLWATVIAAAGLVVHAR